MKNETITIAISNSKKDDDTRYFVAKCSDLIYRLLVGKGPSDERLYENFYWIDVCLSLSLPAQFKSEVEELKAILYTVPETRRIEDDTKVLSTSLQNTIGKMNKTKASNVIGKLYSLFYNVRSFEESRFFK